MYLFFLFRFFWKGNFAYCLLAAELAGYCLLAAELAGYCLLAAELAGWNPFKR